MQIEIQIESQIEIEIHNEIQGQCETRGSWDVCSTVSPVVCKLRFTIFVLCVCVCVCAW